MSFRTKVISLLKPLYKFYISLMTTLQSRKIQIWVVATCLLATNLITDTIWLSITAFVLGMHTFMDQKFSITSKENNKKNDEDETESSVPANIA